jgi:hypothetical protein
MKLMLKIAGGIIIAIILLAVGCSVLVAGGIEESSLDDDAGVIRVQAPAGMCWSGAIGDSSKEGCGNKSFPIEGEAIIVGNAQKQTEGKWKLTLILEVNGEEKDRSSTTAQFGVATVNE